MTTADTAPPTELTPEQINALEVARGLAAAGIPLFLGWPDPNEKIGFKLTTGWQTVEADPSVVDRWRPGMALCAVMGQGLDLIDVDPRNGGNAAAINGSTPTSYGIAFTPSGGMHSFIRSLGTGSRDNVYPGIDVKSGLPDGSGRGFAFLAPTVRPSKVTGQLVAYNWAQPPDLARLAAAADDNSGAALAARIRELRGAGVRISGGPDWWRTFLDSREPTSAPAAERAIAEKLAEVRDFDPAGGAGFRQVLMRAAMTLGGYVGGGYLEEDDAHERLEAAVAAVWDSPDEDDRLWIAQGLADGAQSPFYVYTAADELAFSEAAQAVAGETEDQGAGPPEPPWNVWTALDPANPFDPGGDSTDQGLADAVAHRMWPALRYATDAGLWIKREREVWTAHSDDLADWIVSALARMMPYGSTPVPKDAGERTEAHWQATRRALFMSSAGAGKITRKLRAIIRSDHPAALRVSELDTNPEILWAGAMPYDLRASIERPTVADWVDPATPHLHTALCAPQVIETPLWDAFVAAVLPDPATRAWALRVLAVALTGYPDAALPVLYGRERSGKTSLVELLVRVLGSYAHAANPKLLGDGKDHDAIVYDLKGRRLSFIDEGPKRGHEATERLKQLTGGGSLTARAMNANPVTFSPTHTLVMTTNNEPHLTDPALRARMRLIPCNSPEETVRPARARLNGAALREEAPGILATLMREAAAWLADRDSATTAAAPVEIRALAEEIAARQDPVREWVELCTVPADPGTPGRTLYTQFASWHQDQPLFRRMSIPSETAFGRSLTDMGYPGSKLHGLSYRPLSVLSGPAGIAPWEPVPDPHMTRGSTPAPTKLKGELTVEPSTVNSPLTDTPSSGPTDTQEGGLEDSSGGFTAEPSRLDNPSSTPVFPTVLEGLEGFREEEEEEEEIHPLKKYTANREKPSTLPTLPGTGGQKPTLTSANTPLAGCVEGPSSLPPTMNSAEADSASPDLSRRVTNTDVAARADAEQITKTEARARINAERAAAKAEAKTAAKAAARLAAIRETSGEVLPLPAVVDRDGHVLPVTSEQAAAVVRAAVTRSGALTVDVETSGYPVGHADYMLRSVQLGDATAAVVFEPVEHAELIRQLIAEAPELHAHSATADLVPLDHAGLLDAESAWARMRDTVIPALLADPTSTGSDAGGLKELSASVLGNQATSPAAEKAKDAVFKAGGWLKETQVDTPPARSGWAQIETGCVTMLRYAASDVLDTAGLAQALPAIPEQLLARERVTQQMTARVTHRGIRIDHERVQELTAKHSGLAATAGERVRAFGIDNPGSDKQVAQALLGLGVTLPATPKGRPSVAKHVLKLVRHTGEDTPAGELASALLDYRHSATVLSLFLEPYRLLCERGDGRARPTIYTLGTDTGRMSSVRPNSQQLSREGGVRSMYTADPGYLFISADFSGVELCGAAALSQDATLLRFLEEGRDLHAEVALQAFGPDDKATQEAGRPAPTKANRYIAKPGVFGHIYGGGVPTLAQQVGVTQHEMGAIVASLQALTPGLATWSDELRKGVRAGHTQFPAYSGRIIHLPRDYPHKAPNYAIQGSCRELLVDALLRWRETPWGNCTLLPVHDELLVMVPEADAERATAALVACMESELYGVKIKAEPSEPSFAWADSS